jgi:hypothetical protein
MLHQRKAEEKQEKHPLVELFALFIAANPQQRGKGIGVNAQVEAMVDWAQKESAHNERVKRLFDAFKAKCAKTPCVDEPSDYTCVECQQLLPVRETLYLVRGEVWRAAGMPLWDSGYLHRACLEKRLGRKLTGEDYLVRVVGQIVKPDGEISYKAKMHPDYLNSPEALSGGLTPSDIEEWRRLWLAQESG